MKDIIIIVLSHDYEKILPLYMSHEYKIKQIIFTLCRNIDFSKHLTSHCIVNLMVSFYVRQIGYGTTKREPEASNLLIVVTTVLIKPIIGLSRLLLIEVKTNNFISESTC